MDVNQFIDAFCMVNNLDVDKLLSNHRAYPYQDYRRVLIYILNNKFDLIPNRIKEIMNKRSHSSIIKSLQVHDDLIRFNKKYRELYHYCINS